MRKFLLKHAVVVFYTLFAFVLTGAFMIAVTSPAESSSFDTIRLVRGYASDFTGADPILPIGTIGYEIDTRKMKMGNGNTAWSSLAYLSNDATDSPTLAGLTTTGTVTAGTLSATTIAGTTYTGIGQAEVAGLTTADSPTFAGVVSAGAITGLLSVPTGSANAIVCVKSTGRYGICSGSTGTTNSTCTCN